MIVRTRTKIRILGITLYNTVYRYLLLYAASNSKFHFVCVHGGGGGGGGL